MKLRALLVGFMVSALLLAAAGYLYANPADESARGFRRAVSAVQKIQAVSADWSIELARVHANPFADFDGLAAFVPVVADLKAELAYSTRSISDLPAPLESEIAAYADAVSEKEKRIERYKTDYAVLRNSLRHMPVVAATAEAAAREADDDALAGVVAHLAAELEAWLIEPGETAAGTAAAAVRAVRGFLTVTSRTEGQEPWPRPTDGARRTAVASPYPPLLTNALMNMLGHADVLLNRLEPTEELFRAATSNEISGMSNRLARNLEAALVGRENLAERYEQGMFGVVGLLALFWVGLAFHQSGRRAAPVPAAAAPAPAATEPEREAEPARPAAPAFGRRRAAAPAPGEFAAHATAADPRRALEQGFVAESVAGAFSESTDRIASDMRRLQQAHDKVRGALQETEGLVEPVDGGGDVDNELETAASLAANSWREAEGLAELARRMASFSRTPGGFDRAAVDVNRCVEETVAELGVDAVAAVTKNLGSLPEIFASRAEIRLLLAKIIENAMGAVEAAGDREGAIRIDTSARDNDILVTIIDNGVGITQDRRKKIFRPFYTSREGAMGVGLTLAEHLAKKYDGRIRVNSLPGQGTMTRITLRAHALDASD